MKKLRLQKIILLTASLTELGERYVYYTIQSLLIFYFIKIFNYDYQFSTATIGNLLAVTYISSIIGGYVGDKLIGYYLASLIGALFLILGNFCIILSKSENFLFWGLSFLALSSGLIKSNIASFIGEFYDRFKSLENYRDSAFSFFYVGINAGGFLALFFSSYFSENYGLISPFYFSLLFAFFTFFNLFFSHSFFLKNYLRNPKINFLKIFKLCTILLFYLFIIFSILKNQFLANCAMILIILICCVILSISFKKVFSKNKKLVISTFFIFSLIYWTLFFQFFISFFIFISKFVEHLFFGVNIKASQFLCFESIGVLIFGPILGKIWLFLTKKKLKISEIDKFIVSFSIILLIFLLVWIGIKVSFPTALVNAGFFILAFLLLALSELFFSPTGLSLITKLAPPKYLSLYMGIWLVTLGLGGKNASIISQKITISENILLSKSSMISGLQLQIFITLFAILVCFIFKKVFKSCLKS